MNPKIAIYVSGGVVQGIRSNMKDLDVEIVDGDDIEDHENTNDLDGRWEQLQLELEFGNY
jgi:hypothetical protein